MVGHPGVGQSEDGLLGIVRGEMEGGLSPRADSHATVGAEDLVQACECTAGQESESRADERYFGRIESQAGKGRRDVRTASG